MSISPKTVQLGEEAVRLVVSRMPALISLKVSSWDIDYHWFMKEMREEAKREGVCYAYFVLYLKLKAPLHIALSTALISFFFEIHKDFHVGDNEDDVWESH